MDLLYTYCIAYKQVVDIVLSLRAVCADLLFILNLKPMYLTYVVRCGQYYRNDATKEVAYIACK